MFNPDNELRYAIFDILKNDGKSISALSRELETKGYKIHRLILTGYLRALTDYNYLREKEIPPAKVYIPVKGNERTIYEIVGDIARQNSEGEETDILILYALGRIFHRSIFIDELKKAGVKTIPNARQASNEERLEARRVVQRSGMKLSDLSQALIFDDRTLEPKYEEMLSMMIVSIMNVSTLVRETKQTKLSLDSPSRE